MRPPPGALALLALCASACVSTAAAPDEALWRADWNARVDAHRELREHPCGDFEFEPWVRGFLEHCPDPHGGGAGCKERWKWANQRSRQCAVWKTWLLRNHNQQKRRDAMPEPPTRVP